ncbi:MAG: protein kinase domain-containing protein [Alphaproteobacteria bacterium]
MAIEHLNALPNGYELEEYHFERVLGAGGFGITYLAHEKTLKRKVAIKEFLPRDIAVRGDDGTTIHPVSSTDLEDYEYGLERFRDEARTLVSFRHPNIVAVHRLLEANNTAYLVMEYEEGDSLDAILKRDGALSEAEVKEFLFPLLDGLDRVHKAGFLHRDIKPANIYIRHDGSPVLIDFGAARQALGDRSGGMTAIVTTGYAPMEQYSVDGKQGAYSDLYAMAATAYKSLTGKRPPDAVRRASNDPYTAATVAGRGKADPAFLEAIDWALVTEARDRPQSVGAWLAALHGGEAASDATIRRPAPTPAPAAQATDRQAIPPLAGADEPTRLPPVKKASRAAAPWLIGGGIALVVLIAAGGGWFLYQAQEAEKREEQARLAAARLVVAQKKARQAREEAAREARRKAKMEEQRKKKDEIARRKAEEKARRGGRAGALAVLKIAVINKCYKSVNVAYRYRQENGKWITHGWHQIAKGRTLSWKIRATSRTFYIYAESFDKRFSWSGRNKSGSISAPVVYRKFAHTTGLLAGPGRKTVSFARKTIRPAYSGFDQSYTCN